MTVDKEPEYEEPAVGDKAEAIRRKYCLENNQVYESVVDDYTFFKSKSNVCYNNSDIYYCFEESELDKINHNGKTYYIKKS